MLMERVNKTKARNLFNKGVELYILPSRIRLGNGLMEPCKISNSNKSNFDSIINEYEYYNCNKNTGKKTAFYVGITY